MLIRLWGLLAVACGGGSEPEEVVMQPASSDLTWSLSRSDAELQLDYTYTNRQAEVVYVADRVLSRRTGSLVVTDRAVVDSPRASVARVTLARVSGQGPSASLSPVRFTKVAPGASHQGSLTLPSPLQSWHPDTSMAPLDGVEAVAFRLATIVGEPPQWRTLTLGDGTLLKVPDAYTTTFVDGGTQSLP